MTQPPKIPEVRQRLRVAFGKMILHAVQHPSQLQDKHLITMLASAFSLGIVEAMSMLETMDSIELDEVVNEAVRLAYEVKDGKMKLEPLFPKMEPAPNPSQN